jgi:hypothetical protein
VSEIAAAEWEEQQKLKAIYDANSWMRLLW